MSGSLHTWYSLPDLDAFAGRRAELHGDIELKQLSRLRDMLHADNGSVRVGLRFAPGGNGWLSLKLEYEVGLRLVCQRCLEPMDYLAAAVVDLGIIENAAAETLLPEGYEPVMLYGERLKPAQLLEDELLIALPLAPKHEELEQCGGLALELDRLGRQGGAERLQSVPPKSH